ncbi:MAG: AcrR family transcriptional regulator [Myxococcota bacterium]|jgi:AcrR family transcriptional regulator
MSRPVNADAAATRQRILSAALQLFASQGERTSIRSIAGEAGVSIGMVHHYFGSKDGLRDACVEEMYAELSALQDRLMPTLLTGDTLANVLPAAVRLGFQFACEHRLAVRLLNRQVMAVGTLSTDRRMRFQAPFLDLLTAALSQTGQPQTTIRLSLQTVVMLLARYAISAPEELAFFVNDSEQEPLVAVEDHLVTVACSLLLRSPQ